MAEIKSNDWVVKVETKLEGEQWETYLKKARNALRAEVVVPGFRKGKAPINKLDARISIDKVFDKAIKSSQNVAIEKLDQKAAEQNKNLFWEKSISLKLENINEKELAISGEYIVIPHITLGDYKSLKIKLENLNVPADLIEKIKKEKLDKYAVKLESEEPIKLGDEVNFDFTGFIDGKEFEGGKAEGFDLEIGSKRFIPGFEEKMIGLKKGEEKDLKLKFPTDYHVKHLAGKDVVFKVKINSIKTISLPEITDSFVAELNLSPLIKTKKDFEQYINTYALAEHLKDVESDYSAKLSDKVNSLAKFEIHEAIIENRKEQTYHAFLRKLEEQQITEDEFLESAGLTKEEYLKDNEEKIIKELKSSFIMGAMAEAEKINITYKDYEKYVGDIAANWGLQNIDIIKQYIPFSTYQTNEMTKKLIEKMMNYTDPEAAAEYKKLDSKVKKYFETLDKAKFEKDKAEDKKEETKETKSKENKPKVESTKKTTTKKEETK